jgi:hypothetical protein
MSDFDDPDYTRPIVGKPMLVPKTVGGRAFAIAIDEQGSAHRVFKGNTYGFGLLPRGWRWANEGDAHVAEVAHAVEARRWNASKR